MTRDEFITRHPEFETADPDQVNAQLAAAERSTPANVWGDKQGDGISWLAAHMLALSPSGMNARKISPERISKTIYWHRRKELEREVAGGPRVF